MCLPDPASKIMSILCLMLLLLILLLRYSFASFFRSRHWNFVWDMKRDFCIFDLEFIIIKLRWTSLVIHLIHFGVYYRLNFSLFISMQSHICFAVHCLFYFYLSCSLVLCWAYTTVKGIQYADRDTNTGMPDHFDTARTEWTSWKIAFDACYREQFHIIIILSSACVFIMFSFYLPFHHIVDVCFFRCRLLYGIQMRSALEFLGRLFVWLVALAGSISYALVGGSLCYYVRLFVILRMIYNFGNDTQQQKFNKIIITAQEHKSK